MMNISGAGIARIKATEGLRLEAYPDPGSVDGKPVTIGYGSTKKLDGSPWQLGDRITEDQATALLVLDVSDAVDTVNRLVRVPLTQAQFDSLCSLCFNIGNAAFSGSTLLRKLNSGDYLGAAAEFDRWVYNDGKKMAGLVTRRRLEREAFASEIPPAEVPAPITESTPTWEAPMSPFVIAALPALVEAIPGLIRSFGKGEVTERNAKAAEAVLQVVQQATGATNAQAAVEAVTHDPALRAAATEALAADHWFETTEAGGGGIEGARAFSKNAIAKGDEFWRMGVFWVTLALLPLLYGTVYLVLTGSTEQFSGELRAAIASSVVTGVLGGVIGFWLGLKFNAPKADAIALGR